MKFKSGLVTQASGSIGGLTASRNRGGLYLRARAMPTNPSSDHQAQVRGIVASLSNRWANVLTANEREAWSTYALNVPLPDTLGELRNIGAIGHFVRANVPRIQTEKFDEVDAGPVVFDTGEFTNPSISSVDQSAGQVTLAFDTDDDWVSEDGAGMIILMSRGSNQSINYWKGPYLLADSIVGDSTTPPTSPFVFAPPAEFSITAGRKYFFQVRVTRADGRLSFPFRVSKVAVA